jgi:inhibitor of KinA
MGEGSYRFMNSWASTLFKKAYFVSQLYAVAEPKPSYQLFPLGDSAITIDLGNCIDDQLNRHALALYDWLAAHRFSGVLDIIVAYSSVSVFYDPLVIRASGMAGSDTAAEWVGGWLARAWQEAEAGHAPRAGGHTPRAGGSDRSGGSAEPEAAGPIVAIPVCYEGEYAPDLDWVARQKGLSGSEVVSIQSNGIYRVYMIGFLPGFSYMGILDKQLQLTRKPKPVAVAAGGVGIAGSQTGIYPLNSPGGWQIIGRTPMRFFDAAEDPPVRLKTGDQVRFCPISAAEFRRLSGRPG